MASRSSHSGRGHSGGQSHSVSGGKSTKMKKFPRILDYLEAKHPKVYDVIESLSMHGVLTPRRGGAITFLLPDAKLVAEMAKLVDSDQPEIATDILSSLVLQDLFETDQDFAKKKDDIPTGLGKKLIVKSVSTGKVTIDAGELTPDPGFVPFARQGNSVRGNMAVWRLAGRVEYEKAPKSEGKYARPGKGATTGGSDGGAGPTAAARLAQLTVNIERAMVAGVAAGRTDCQLINAVCRVVRVMRDDMAYHDLYRKFRCIFKACYLADFWILFRNPDMFPADRILAAYDAGVDEDCNADTLRGLLSDYAHPSLAGQAALCLQERGSKQLSTALETVRGELLGPTMRDLSKRVTDLYREVDTANALRGVGPIYPDAVIGDFRTHPGLHLLIDELTFICHTYMRQIHTETLRAPAEQAKAIDSMLCDLRCCYKDLTEAAKKSRMNRSELYVFDSQNHYDLVGKFWRTYGLHICGCAPQDAVRVGSAEDDNPHSSELVDVDGYYGGLIDDVPNNPLQLSASTLAELRAYKRTHGKLPTDL